MWWMGVQTFHTHPKRGVRSMVLSTANSELLDLRPALATRAPSTRASNTPHGMITTSTPDKSKYKFGVSLKFGTLNFEAVT